HAIPAVFIKLPDVLAAAAHAHVVHQDIEPAVALDGRGNDIGAHLAVGDVAADDKGLAACLHDQLARFLCAFGFEVDEADARAFAGIHHGNRLAGAEARALRSGTGDDGYPAG